MSAAADTTTEPGLREIGPRKLADLLEAAAGNGTATAVDVDPELLRVAARRLRGGADETSRLFDILLHVRGYMGSTCNCYEHPCPYETEVD